MFCLRGWVPLLIFITNASPIYVLLFLTGTFLLSRPCVYCSILLFVLVFSLFDFHADWFEPRWQPSTLDFTETASSLLSGNATITEVLRETASLMTAAINGTGGSLASAAIESVAKRKLGMEIGVPAGGFEWLRSLTEKRGFHISCIDVNVRL